MEPDALAHDAAVAAAMHLVEIISPCLREDEKPEAFREFYSVCLAMIAAYEEQVSRQQFCLLPSDN